MRNMTKNGVWCGVLGAALVFLLGALPAEAKDAIKAVLLDAVSGFEEHEGMHDHLWRKQRANSDERSSNVQELFPERSADK